MGFWSKLKALFKKDAEYVDYDQFHRENYDKIRFNDLEKYKKRP